MDIDVTSVDSLLNTYPSLKRLPDKDRVRRIFSDIDIENNCRNFI